MTAQALTAGLGRLEAALRRYRAPVLAQLRPGLAADVVRERLAAAGLAAPSEVRTWFGWHDGARRPPPVVTDRPSYSGGLGLLSGWETPPLEDCLQLHAGAADEFATEDGDPVPTSWLPILMLSSTVVACVDTATPGPDSPVHVVDPWAPGENWFRARWPSLAAWVQDALVLHDAGRVRLHETGAFQLDLTDGWPLGMHAPGPW